MSEGVVDKIALCDARKNTAWKMVWAAEPDRQVDVRMSYTDLEIILRWIDEKTRGVCRPSIF